MLRDITIKSVLNGWVLKVGCQTVVFNDKGDMLDEISAYLDDPDGVEKAYQGSAVNAKHVFSPDVHSVEEVHCTTEEAGREMRDRLAALRGPADE